MNRLCYIFVLLLGLAVWLGKTDYAFGKTTWYPNQALQTKQQLLISGNNKSDMPTIIVVRIDDSQRPNYQNRVNYERTVLPGAFAFSISLDELYTSNKRKVIPADIVRVIVFAGLSDADIVFNPVQLQVAETFSKDVLAWDFGATDSKVWPGFTRISPNDDVLKGQTLQALQRDQHHGVNEGLITDGIKGVQQIHLPLAPGRYHVALWLHDMGDWEYVPHYLTRRVVFNHTILFKEAYTPARWLSQKYLKMPLTSEANTSVFDALIKPFYGAVTATIEVTDAQPILHFHGDDPDAQYIAGLLITPLHNQHTFAEIQNQRAQWWQRNWPIMQNYAPPQAVMHYVSEQQGLHITTVADANQHIPLTIHNAEQASFAQLQLVPHNHAFEVTLRKVQWALRRQSLQGNVLQWQAQRLTESLHAQHVPGLPQYYYLSVQTTTHTKPGTYTLYLNLVLDGVQQRVPITVEILDVALPRPAQSIGVYLEQPPHHLWFNERRALQTMQCDMDVLAKLGLTAVAPGFTTPNSAYNQQRFIMEYRSAVTAGLGNTVLAYAPYKRMLAQMGPEQTVATMSAINRALSNERQHSPLLWSIADEPSNAASQRLLIHNLEVEGITGHFNHSSDKQWFAHMDSIFVNEGLPLSTAFFSQLETDVYLYNFPKSRLAAGVLTWFWETKGYFQWHARMPTAYPFSPIDGREDDVQMFYPQAADCQKHDIDEQLLLISEGIMDLRWLVWLSQQASKSPEAAMLIKRIRATLKRQPTELDIQQLNSWRADIQHFARSLTHKE